MSTTPPPSAEIQPSKIPIRQRPYAVNSVSQTSGANLVVCAPAYQLFSGVIVNSDTVSYGLTLVSTFGNVPKITMPQGALVSVRNFHILALQLDATQKISVFGAVTEFDNPADYLDALKFAEVSELGVFAVTGGGNPVNNRSAFSTGQQNVTTAGTPVQLNGGTALTIPNGFSLLIRAKQGNTKNISWSDTSAHATYTNNTGDILAPGATAKMSITDVSKIWIDSQVNAEGVSWAVEQ